MKRSLPALFLCLSLSSAAIASPEADAAWKKVTALDAGPGRFPTNREEAQAIALQFLQAKEEALRAFLAAHAGDPRATEALIRLAHVLTSRSDFSGQAALYENAVALLDKAFGLASKANRREEMGHLAFAKLGLLMRRVNPDSPTSATQAEQLLSQIRGFRNQFPGDARFAPLLAEVATLYDEQPKKKQSLLEEALREARSEEVKERVQDDLKRLAFLGAPVSLKGSDISGSPIDSTALRGKIVVAYFFAGFSPASLDGLAEINALRASFPTSQVEVFGICIDPTAEAVRAIMQAKGVAWPVIWEGKGWKSPLLRHHAINTLPTTWVLDRNGRLRTLNARGAKAGATVRALLKETVTN